MANVSRIEGREAADKTTSSNDSAKGASANPRITYSPRPDATPEGELRALAACYAFAIGAHQQKKTAAPVTRKRKEVNPEERRLGQGQ